LLIIHAFIGNTEISREHIGQIQIQRQEKRTSRRKIYTYKIVVPHGFEEHTIKHRRDDGWKVLLRKVLRIITKP
jgi:hypothetical protein